MQVGIVEPRHGEAATEIHDLRLRAFEFVEIDVLADGEYAVALDGDSFGPQHGTERRIGGDAGVDVAMHKDGVCLWLEILRGARLRRTP
jgi:hypothetical protein